MWVFLHECSWCKRDEERLFTDCYTGIELCLECLGRVANYVTNSPASEGDNLAHELLFRAGDLRAWDDEDDEEGEDYSWYEYQDGFEPSDGWSGPEPHADLLLSD